MNAGLTDIPEIPVRPSRIILGSASPRRREYFGRIFPEHSCLSTDLELSPHSGEEPVAFACKNSRFKAESILQENPLQAEDYLFCFDTVVYSGSEILGKPVDREDARRMLMGYSGDSHSVVTGYAIFSGDSKFQYVGCEVTEVFFYPLDPVLVERYLDTGDAMDKAGAYGIQGWAGRLIRKIEGCYDNVVGLPIPKLFHEIRAMGFESY